MRRPKRGDIVYLRTGEDRDARIITGTTKRDGGISYELACGVNSTWHSRIEFDYNKPTGKFPEIKGLKQ